MKGSIGETVEQEDKLDNEVETVREFTYLGYSVSEGGGCEAAVTVRTRCGWFRFKGCGELLYGWRFPLGLKGAVCESYVCSAVLYGNESWCLIESDL